MALTTLRQILDWSIAALSLVLAIAFVAVQGYAYASAFALLAIVCCPRTPLQAEVRFGVAALTLVLALH